MKITFILPWAGLSGGNKVVAIYAKKLMENGHEVTVISQPAANQKINKKVRKFVRTGVWPKTRARSPHLDFLGRNHVTLDESRPPNDNDVPDADVVIATWWETAEWVARLGDGKGRKYYLLQDYEIFPHLPADRVINTFSLPLKKIAVSSFIKNVLKENHQIDDVTVINNAVDLEHFCVPDRKKNAKFTVGFLYQIGPRKNSQLAIDVVKNAKNSLNNLNVVSFGKDNPKNLHDFPKWIEYHYRPEQVEIPNIYAKCDLWLFTSSSEGFGLPILEAMACRTPVLATRAGASPELINSQNGALLETDGDEFLKQLQRFEQMGDAEWQQFSQSAFETARSYSWDDATKQFENCLREG